MSDPITCIKKPEPTAHTPGPWRAINSDLRDGGNVVCLSTANDQTIALVLSSDADLALIAQAPALLAHAEKSLMWLIAERDCHYEGCSIKSNGEVLDIDDQMTLDHYDRDIEQLRALIAACKGEA